MKNAKILVGYSLRSLIQDDSWTKERRENFLINPSVELPKSASTVVWENVSDFINDDFYFLDNYGFQDIKELVSLSNYNQNQLDRVMVRTCVHYLYFVPNFVWSLNMPSFQDDGGFHFIGYDIADGGMTSGLSNCGYTQYELKYCQEKYSIFLNKHGLFKDFNIALDFLYYTNLRVKEHAPFYIYSLYSDRII